jgi:hypothetical protein
MKSALGLTYVMRFGGSVTLGRGGRGFSGTTSTSTLVSFAWRPPIQLPMIVYYPPYVDCP